MTLIHEAGILKHLFKKVKFWLFFKTVDIIMNILSQNPSFFPNLNFPIRKFFFQKSCCL